MECNIQEVLYIKSTSSTVSLVFSLHLLPLIFAMLWLCKEQTEHFILSFPLIYWLVRW